MPSALETLVKILKLERDNGYKNNAVIGGLAAYGKNWLNQAHEQARRPEHHILVDELVDLMQTYDVIDNRNERHDRVTYMMDRIMGRVQPPQQYIDRLGNFPQEERPSKPEKKSAPPPPPKQQPKAAEPERDNQEDNGEIDYNADDEFIGTQDQHSTGTDLPPEPRLARPPRRPRPRMDEAEARDTMRGLNASVDKMKGVGPRMVQALGKLGIERINDLLFCLPRRYDDYTKLTYISKLQPDQIATVIGTVRYVQVRETKGGQRKDFYLELDDGSGVISVTFFGQHYLSRAIRVGKQLVLSGKTSIFRNRIQMNSPEWEELDAENLHTVGIVPVYPLTEGLTARRMRTLMKEVVDYWAEKLPDYMPEATLARAELGDLGWSIKNLHFPEGSDHLYHARRRYVFDQLILLQLSIMANRREWQSTPAQSLHITDEFIESFTSAVFPYELTGAQKRAIADVRRDIAEGIPMNRLLQGDVGSGKTAVALTTMAMAFSQGKQSALMAPTSILAEQHYRGIIRTVESFPGDIKPNVALLTGSLTNAEREAIYEGLRNGSIDMVIGTHALIQEGVDFHDLAIAIIDEQHRFGVEQRGKLRSKGMNPHLLVMTATPIPRTLALTLYADLDLSIMDEMPPGRIPIQTRIVQPIERERIYSFIEAEVKRGRQAFVVYPLVEASEKIEAESAVEAYEHLSKVFFRYRVGLLHGKMKPAEKDEIMASFANHEFDIMVTTSVAEVGVDIPNATVIAIEGANRFGLASLHQFRGRVGRGGFASYCLLIPDKDTPEAMERLQAMESTNDGFKLAEIDWKMRGAGDLIGTRQSGRNTLQITELMQPDLVSLAQQEAKTIYVESPDLSVYPLLKERVDMLYNEDTDVS